MQIQLKQSEITDALKQYIVKQGLSLQGKTVDISFTAGRGVTGITADVLIEDSAQLPLLDNDDDDAPVSEQKPALSVVTNDAPEANEPQAPEVVVVADGDEAAPKSAKSLFG